jgi:RNA recognition motif-containing protein
VSTTLYINNLPLTATEDALAVKFTQFGTVISTRVNRDPSTGRSLRSGFVEMKTSNDAQTAIDRLNLADYDGRVMSVSRALGAAKASN